MRSGFGGKTSKSISSAQQGRQRLPERTRGGADTVIRSAFGSPSLWFDARDGVAATALENPVCKAGAMTQSTSGKRADLNETQWKDGGPCLVFAASSVDNYESTSLNLNGTKLASLYTTLKNSADNNGYVYEYTAGATTNNGCYLAINDRPSGGDADSKPFALNGQSGGYQAQYYNEEVDTEYGVIAASFDRSAGQNADKTKMSWTSKEGFEAGDTDETQSTPPTNNFDGGATSFIGARAGGTGAPGPLDGDVREIVAYGGIAHSEAERFKISIALAYKAAI